jgi:hypothetical protein
MLLFGSTQFHVLPVNGFDWTAVSICSGFVVSLPRACVLWLVHDLAL